MRYKLQRNANGMITQCENADGGNIYVQREELNKKALENLKKAEPSGKLGVLSNLQVFNANISAFSSSSTSNFYQEYNNTVNFPALMDPCFVFGSANGSNASGLYYNIVGLNANLENNLICAAAYNKKQEFGPSYIAIPSKSCPNGKLAIQNKSILEKK